uniref:Single-pass membrane and coiled-coil domain-containing protein 4 n=1 Tax=Vombatus ursinus TaxID=29139 RepID=A0A4X2LS63_VOMUR
MRQLKGKPKKETSKVKKEWKQAMQEVRQQITTAVLPKLAVVVVLIVVSTWPHAPPSLSEPYLTLSQDWKVLDQERQKRKAKKEKKTASNFRDFNATEPEAPYLLWP